MFSVGDLVEVVGANVLHLYPELRGKSCRIHWIIPQHRYPYQVLIDNAVYYFKSYEIKRIEVEEYEICFP